jgi:hypothetical protein
MPTPERRQIVLVEEPAFGAVEGKNSACDVAAVERIARRLKGGNPTATRRGPLLVGEKLQGRSEVGLNEFFAQLRRPTVRQIDFDGRGKAADRLLIVADEIGHMRIDWETLAGDADRRRRHFGERHRAIFFSRAVVQASGAAGTTVRSTPTGILPP